MIQSKHAPALPDHVCYAARRVPRQTSPAESCPAAAGWDDEDEGDGAGFFFLSKSEKSAARFTS